MRGSKLTVCVVSALIAILMMADSPVLSQDVFQMALAVYKQKRYSEAATYFYKITVIDPKNVEAYVYYANCMNLLGNTDVALRSYWYVVRTFPSSRKAYEIRDFLKKSDRNYAQHAADPSYASFGTGSAPKTATSARSSSQRSTSSASSGDVVEDIVKVVRPLKDRPAISEGLISRTKTALREYPPGLLKVVYGKGCRIWLTPTMIDKEPSLENQQPAGYMEGHSYKDCPGMFYSGGIVVCEYTIGNGFDWDHVEDPIGTLHHELGHAVDFYLGQISDTEEYKHAYRLDCGQIKDESVRNKINYFLQKDFRGPAESFAELMCARYGGRSGKKDSTTEIMNSNFPLTKQVIEKKIATASQ